ncbi:hypothetical protein BDN72DRAFT_900269 [Pluteus cervinus]|uniref:Uncharacterized protein n=1 Tax=Pluteus cervinus TaxID=181527 RepID=A0ACD3AK61_9AGAR|nr:hypothetical protein BDN72DRAFT_900269 [Pluteus cervinus]
MVISLNPHAGHPRERVEESHSTKKIVTWGTRGVGLEDEVGCDSRDEQSRPMKSNPTFWTSTTSKSSKPVLYTPRASRQRAIRAPSRTLIPSTIVTSVRRLCSNLVTVFNIVTSVRLSLPRFLSVNSSAFNIQITVGSAGMMMLVKRENLAACTGLQMNY